ncbi:hypothetical protein ACET3Z_030117 [Daucus carota]
MLYLLHGSFSSFRAFHDKYMFLHEHMTEVLYLYKEKRFDIYFIHSTKIVGKKIEKSYSIVTAIPISNSVFASNVQRSKTRKRSSQILRSTESETHHSDLVHLPVADESSLNQLVEQSVKSMINNSFSSRDWNLKMMHWSHNHPLKLITNNELNDQQDDDRIVLLC